MTPEGWVLNIGALLGAVFASYQASIGAKEAKKARELSEPTGNGFARMVMDKLNSVEDKIKSVESKMDTHIHDHATDAFDRGKREQKLDREQRARDERNH